MNSICSMCTTKKGMVFSIAFMVAVIFLISYAFFSVYVQDNKFGNRVIGQDQLSLFNTINEAEKALVYIDQSAQYAYTQSYYDIAKQGGYETCGNYRGVTLWLNKGVVCTPKFEENLNIEFNFDIDNYLRYYPEFGIPIQNYDVFFSDGKLIGIAREPLELEIETLEKLKYESPYEKVEVYKIPRNAKAKVQWIYKRYKPFIEQASLETGVEISWIVAVIVQESNGNPTAKSKVGAKGLMQLMDSTAQRMAKELPISSDYSIFDPQTNIRLGTRYIKVIMASNLIKEGGEDGVVDIRHIPAAYNGGTCNKAKTRGALCYSNTCLGRRFWECEANKGYRQTREYVPAVLAYKKAFEEWQQELHEVQTVA